MCPFQEVALNDLTGRDHEHRQLLTQLVFMARPSGPGRRDSPSFYGRQRFLVGRNVFCFV